MRVVSRAVRGRRVLLHVVYWLAVLAISVALLIALVLFFEAHDDSSLDRSSAGAIAAPA